MILRASFLRSATALALLAAALASRADVIDFENLSNPATGFVYNPQTTPVVSGGYSFAGGLLGTVPSNSPSYYTGSVALTVPVTNTAIEMTRVGGGLFTLGSVQMANLYRVGTGDPPPSVLFTGTKASGGTVTRSFQIANVNALQTVALADFTDLVSVRLVQSAGFYQFDNVVVTSQAVPEPSALLALGLPALALLRRRAKRA